MGCTFCQRAQVSPGGDLIAAFYDNYAVTAGHTLFVPRRHVETWFDLTVDERRAIDAAMEAQAARLKAEDPTIAGFNIGWNCGAAAGQTVPHAHGHLIPRRAGDMDDPRGGVRGVIPDKQKY